MLRHEGFSSESSPADSIDPGEAAGKPDCLTSGLILSFVVKARSKTYFPFILKRRHRFEVPYVQQISINVLTGPTFRTKRSGS